MSAMIARRQFLRLSAAGAALLIAPRIAFARAATERRFVFIIQRGAADGLSIAPPQGDPAFASLRGALAETANPALKLDGMFGLHPALTQIGGLYAKKQALIVHAVASPYRERSHFDGQNVLETGGQRPYQVKDGWMNRLVAQLPRDGGEAIAFAPTVPLALRGGADVTSFAPSALPQAPDDLLVRVGQLYAQDAQLGPLWQKAMETRGMAGDANGPGGARQDPASLGKLAAGFLARPDGPRLAMLETGGWDTHTAQAGRLAAQLRALDTLVAALRDGLGAVWSDTVVLIATEFGRTAAVNGTGGTDHGTGSAALLLGGAVKGGRVVADWPGLGAGALYEGRDLRPTTDLDALIAGAAAETYRLDPERTMTALSGRPGTRAMSGLIA
jgi:uncharacterized protein (DUF1501 family)